MIIALTLVVIGLVFFARALGFIGNDTLNVVWPLLLIVVGISMLAHRGDERGWWDHAVRDFQGKKKKGKSKRS